MSPFCFHYTLAPTPCRLLSAPHTAPWSCISLFKIWLTAMDMGHTWQVCGARCATPPFVCTSTFPSENRSVHLTCRCFSLLPPPGTLAGSPWGSSDAATEAQPTPTTGVAPGARLAFMDLSAGSSDLVRAGGRPPGHTFTLCQQEAVTW